MISYEKKLVVEATMDNLHKVTAFVEGTLESFLCPMKTTMQIVMAVEEIYVNVVNYAYGGDKGDCTLSISLEPGSATITVGDKGKPFNPLEMEEPDISLSAEERPIGGLGIFMVKKSMDEVFYENISGYNRFTIVKRWDL